MGPTGWGNIHSVHNYHRLPLLPTILERKKQAPRVPGSQGGSWSIWKSHFRGYKNGRPADSDRVETCTTWDWPAKWWCLPGFFHWISGVFQFGTNRLIHKIWMSKNHWGDAHELREGVLMPMNYTCDLKLRDCEFKWPGKELISTSEILWTWMSKPERAKHNRSSWCYCRANPSCFLMVKIFNPPSIQPFRSLNLEIPI